MGLFCLTVGFQEKAMRSLFVHVCNFGVYARTSALILLGLCAVFIPMPVVLAASDQEISQDEESVIEEIIVWGRAQQQKGIAKTASEGLVGYADFETRPLQRVGELVEVLPGMVATQHSGEGKANQYYLRGMNLDHGTDFSAYFEGMPVNFRAHAHGQGYLDLNFIVPELVETVRYAKGPYSADRGDFSTAGTTAFIWLMRKMMTLPTSSNLL